jgi:hypothetical protein
VKGEQRKGGGEVEVKRQKRRGPKEESGRRRKNRKEKEGRIDRRLNGGNDCQREINKKGVNWKAVHP